MNKKSKSFCLSAALLLVWVAISFVSSSEDSDAPVRRLSESELKLRAYNLATDCVKSRLKSPGTAEFAGLFKKREHVTRIGPGKYIINSYVDAQNTFGALIRNQWSCTITFGSYEDGYGHKCENVVII